MMRMITNIANERLTASNFKLFNLINAILEKRDVFKPSLFDFALREHNEIRRNIKETVEKEEKRIKEAVEKAH